MTRTDLVISVLAVLAGSTLAMYPFLLVGGSELSFRLLWIYNWLGPVVVLAIALAAAGTTRILRTIATYALLSLIPMGYAVTAAGSFFGPSLTDLSYHVGLLSTVVAVVIARYAGTREGPVPSLGTAIAAGAAGAGIGVIGAIFSAPGIATLLATVIPCEGFECGMGTGLLVYFVVIVLLPIGCAIVGVQVVKRARVTETA